MFWRILKWGGTALVVVIFGLAALQSSTDKKPDGEAQQLQPADQTDIQPAKKFNF